MRKQAGLSGVVLAPCRAPAYTSIPRRIDVSSLAGMEPDMSQSDPAPKLIIDDDWKSQAQAERERLAEKEGASKPAAAGAGAGGAQGEIPPADFPSLVGMLITQALTYMGGMVDRRTGHAIFDPDMAKFYIDLLAVLETKTKGNLSEDESRDLSGAVVELRSRFVELVQMIAQQQARAATSPASAAAGPASFPSTGFTGLHT